MHALLNGRQDSDKRIKTATWESHFTNNSFENHRFTLTTWQRLVAQIKELTEVNLKLNPFCCRETVQALTNL